MAVNNNLNSNITRTSVSDSDKVSSLVTLSPDYLQNRHYRIRHNPIPSDFDNHRYEALEFILCTGGEYSVKISEQSFRMKKGDILFIPPSSSRQFQVQENGELFFFLFDPAVFDSLSCKPAILSFYSSVHFLSMSAENHIYSFVYSSVIQMIQLYFADAELCEINIYSELYKTVSFMCGSSAPELLNTHSDIYNKFVRVLSFIDEHYTEDINLETVATTAGFSKYHFARLFKQYTDTTFYEYLTSKRINTAKELLQRNIPVADVAFQTGFNNLTSFSRSFKKSEGCSPSDYKKMYAIDEKMKL